MKEKPCSSLREYISLFRVRILARFMAILVPVFQFLNFFLFRLLRTLTLIFRAWAICDLTSNDCMRVVAREIFKPSKEGTLK